MVKHIALDTNAAIALLSNHVETNKVLASFDVICLPVITCGELLFGAKNSNFSLSNEKRYLDFIDTCEILEINLVVADCYGVIRFDLKKQGRPIPENDIWIAAICMANNMPLLTYDKHFNYISTIQVLA